jgi:hypothetical protein
VSDQYGGRGRGGGLAERGRAVLWRARERRRGRAGAPGAARVRGGAVALGARRGAGRARERRAQLLLGEAADGACLCQLFKRKINLARHASGHAAPRRER